MSYRVTAMTPTQCKMARTGLGLRAADLAARSNLTRETVARFERGDKMADASVEAMRAALEAAGADFTRRAGRVGVTVPE